MAAQDLASVFNALGQNVRPDVVRQINRRSRILQLVRVVPGIGKNVSFDIEGDGAVAENYADGADVSSFGSDAVTQATLPWGLARGNFAITDSAIAAARRNGNPAGLVGLARRNLANAAT